MSSSVLNQRSLPLLASLILLVSCGSNNDDRLVESRNVTPNDCEITALSILPTEVSRAVGETQQFAATAQCRNGSTAIAKSGVTWTSAAPAVATVDTAGLATAVAEGKAGISAAFGGYSATAQLTVTPAVITAITVTPSPVTKKVGETQSFSASAHYSDGRDQSPVPGVVWSSSDGTVASVNASGLATALTAGSTEIRASSGGKTGAAQMQVTALPVVPLPFKVGAAEAPASFLPLPGYSCLAGYSTFCERKSIVEHDPLLAGAIAVTGKDDKSFILVKTSNIGYFAAYKAGNGPNGIYDVRQRIARELERRHGRVVVSADQIVVTADHSHHAPDTIGIWGGESPLYMAILAEASVQAGVQAFENRREARLYAASVQGPQTGGSYSRGPTNAPDREFRVLYAEDRQGARIATLMNYAPHATVLGSDNIEATGDWTAWAAQIVNQTSGGVGIGLVGALGAMDWKKSGNNQAREAEARQRIKTMLNQAFESRVAVQGNEVKVKTVFIREPLTQPILLANFAPKVALPVVNSSVSIERAETPPWTAGGVIGTYAGAVRLGDIFISTFPGEPFPQLHYALRDCSTLPAEANGSDCGGITGPRVNFLFGAANDFLGYMLYTPEQYQQALQEGAGYLAGCPEEAVLEGAGQQVDGACPDHWTLMVSPTIGRHIVCTVQNAAKEFGFSLGKQNQECPLLTAFDGQAAPAEYPALDPVPLSQAEFLRSPAANLVASCRAQGAPAQFCDGIQQVSEAVGAGVSSVVGVGPAVPPAASTPARAGVASKDASWHLGASAGQFSNSGAGIARNAGFDPFGHSTRKVGSDILGTRIVTRALVVEGANGERVAVVTNDLYLPNDLLQRRVAQKLAEHDRQVSLGLKSGMTRITGDNLSMTSSHSHTSPFYSTPSWGTWIFQDVFDLRFYEYMATQQAEAIIEAVANMKPVRMGGVTVHANDVQSHTYGPKGPPNDSRDGTPAGQPYDYTTQQVTVLRFDDISGAQPKPLANWVIFGVHPEWVWGEEIINGDITHQVMKLLDRETGAMTLWSQNETGSSGPHKDTRVHAPEERREYQESAFSGAERAARLLTDSIKQGLDALQAGNSQAKGVEQFAAFQTRFPVKSVSQRFAPPATRPYPGVSNCNSSRVFEGDVGIPILGFPDCFYDHTEFTRMVTEPFLAALPYSPTQLRDQLLAAGVPIPTSYSATSLTAVEETAAVHLQVFKLGSIVTTMCPCEQFTSGSLNIISRLDKIPNNVWHGFDWICTLPASHALRVNESPAVRNHCTRQNARYPESGVAIPGSLDNSAGQISRIRAQIHNSAQGWELDPVYMFNQQSPAPLMTLGSESEPSKPEDIKGNFTHEEFTAYGYDLVVPVGMANDYWGYMPEYRDYRSFDHYRKALNGLGPHGADFLATRLSRMAANLNGAGVALPTNPLDQPYQAESVRAEATAQMLGELATAYTAVYEATLPADGGTPRITQQPGVVMAPLVIPQVKRFSAAVLKFVGGSNYTDLPEVRVEKCRTGASCNVAVAGDWETYGTQNGEVQLQLKFMPTLGAVPSQTVEIPLAGESVGAAVPDPVAYMTWRAGLFEWEWTASFEAFISELETLGERPRITPAGRYRFVVDGRHRTMQGVNAYQLKSDVFEVVPWNGITVNDLRVEGDGRVSFKIGPVSEYRHFRDGLGTDAGTIDIPESEAPYVVGPIDYPDSYSGGLSWISGERQLKRYAAGRADDQQYCVRCSFRPWADTAQVSVARVTVTRADGATYLLSAVESNGRWITSAAIAQGERAQVLAGGIVDQYGEINGLASVAVVR